MSVDERNPTFNTTDAIVCRLDPSKTAAQLLYATFLGGPSFDRGALRAEERHARQLDRAGDDVELADASSHEATMSAVFDRSWASALVMEASELHATRACERGADYARRLELLALRFKEELPIRDIAKLWSVGPEYLHHQYVQARDEYRDCLREVVAFHQGPQSTERLDEECQRLLALLGA